MTPPLVDYLIARRGLPPRSGLAYDYVVAGDGLFVAADNEHLDARVPVATCPVRGLPEIHAACALRHGRLPVTIWNDVVGTARTWAIAGHEVLLAVVWEPPWGYRTIRPPQIVGAERVIYQPTAATVLEIHSHHSLPAFFSRVSGSVVCTRFGRIGRRRTGKIGW